MLKFFLSTIKKNISLRLNLSQAHWLPRYYILFKKAKFEKNEFILDAGCGLGLVSLALAKRGARVLGIDKSIDNIKEAQKYKKSLNIKDGVYFLVSDLTSLPIKAEILDKIVCLDALEYIREDSLALAEFKRTLKAQGRLFVSVPNGYVCDARLYSQRLLRKIVPTWVLSRDFPGFKSWFEVDTKYMINKLGDAHRFTFDDIKNRAQSLFGIINIEYFIKTFSSLAIDMAYGIKGAHRIRFLLLFIAVRLDRLLIKHQWGYGIFLELIPRRYH